MDVHAPSAAASVAVMVSDRVQPAHREGKRGALFMGRVYCIAIPAGIRSATIFLDPKVLPAQQAAAEKRPDRDHGECRQRIPDGDEQRRVVEAVEGIEGGTGER